MDYFMILDKKGFLYAQEKLFDIVANMFENFNFPVFNIKSSNFDPVGVIALQGQDETLERLINVQEHIKELSSIAFEITNNLIYVNSLNKLSEILSEEKNESLKAYSSHIKLFERNIYLKNAISSIFTFREQLAFLFNDVCGQCIVDKTKISFNNLKDKLKSATQVQNIISNCSWLDIKEISNLEKVFDNLSDNEIKELMEFRHAFSHRTSFQVDIRSKKNYKKLTVKKEDENEVKGFFREMFMGNGGNSLLSINPDKGEVEFLSSDDAEKSFKYAEIYCKVVSIWEKIINESTQIIKDIRVLEKFIE